MLVQGSSALSLKVGDCFESLPLPCFEYFTCIHSVQISAFNYAVSYKLSSECV